MMGASLELLAGLSLVLVGSRLLVDGLRAVSQGWVARLAGAATRSPARALPVGLLMGAALQSTNAVSFIAAGLVAAGALGLGAVLPMVAASYLGSASRLFVVALEVEGVGAVAACLVGLAVVRGRDRTPAGKAGVQAGLGLALILIGSEGLAQAAGALRAEPALVQALSLVRANLLVGLGISVVVGTLAQGMTVSMIVIALAGAGLLGHTDAAVLIVGANLGSGLMAALQASALDGPALQVSRYQLLLKIVGGLVVLPLVVAERSLDGPPLCAWIAAAVPSDGMRVAVFHLLLQAVPLLALLPLNGAIARRLERRAGVASRVTAPLQPEPLPRAAGLDGEDRLPLGPPRVSFR